MKKTVINILIFIFVISITYCAFSEDILKDIQVMFNKINLQVNGVGVNVDNILYNGITYAPVRAVSETLGLTVDWDEKTSTANLIETEQTDANILMLDSDMWQKVSPPVTEQELREANHSQIEWEVIADHNGLKIDKYNRNKSPFVQLITEWGGFIGVNRGEWGGKLYFQPFAVEEENGNSADDYTQYIQQDVYLADAYKIMEGSIGGIYMINEKIYVIEGSNHMTMSSGSIYKLSDIEKSNNNYKYSATKIIDLNDAPCAFTVVNNVTYIVTTENLLKVENEEIIETIIDNAFWKDLYPNSIISIDNSVYIGMRKGIAKINLETKQTDWYVRK